jgi:hypothetical protein
LYKNLHTLYLLYKCPLQVCMSTTGFVLHYVRWGCHNSNFLFLCLYFVCSFGFSWCYYLAVLCFQTMLPAVKFCTNTVHLAFLQFLHLQLMDGFKMKYILSSLPQRCKKCIRMFLSDVNWKEYRPLFLCNGSTEWHYWKGVWSTLYCSIFWVLKC